MHPNCLVDRLQEGHSRCLWIFLQTCPPEPGASARSKDLWYAVCGIHKTYTAMVIGCHRHCLFAAIQICTMQRLTQIISCRGHHLNMREVTSAMPVILQRTVPSWEKAFTGIESMIIKGSLRSFEICRPFVSVSMCSLSQAKHVLSAHLAGEHLYLRVDRAFAQNSHH